MSAASRRRVLEIVATDATFAIQDLRGGRAWVGKCFYCGTRLVVALDGAFESHATTEHILPRGQGGTDELTSLAIACRSCNVEKGRRHDSQRKPDPARIEALLARRRARWRD